MKRIHSWDLSLVIWNIRDRLWNKLFVVSSLLSLFFVLCIAGFENVVAHRPSFWLVRICFTFLTKLGRKLDSWGCRLFADQPLILTSSIFKNVFYIIPSSCSIKVLHAFHFWWNEFHLLIGSRCWCLNWVILVDEWILWRCTTWLSRERILL